MRVLGLDPSLTQFGWAIHDTDALVGTPARCVARGRFRTPAKMTFITRYMFMRESLRAVLQEHKPDRVGIEFPIMDALWSEGMYGLFLYSCEALHAEWNHNEADAYLVGVLAARFWDFYDGRLEIGGLTETETRYFTKVHTFVRGAKAGKTIRKGMVYRESDRFFLWSRLRDEEINDGKSEKE